MARRKTPGATAAAILPLALAMLPGIMHTEAPADRTPVAQHATATAAAQAGIAEIYPDSEQTPGAGNPDITQENLAQNLCSTEWKTSEIRPPSSYTTKLKKEQMVTYGFTVPDAEGTCMANSDNPKCYEEDHLISLENGGDPKNPDNLWPEPYFTKVNGQLTGARQKDLVEGFIHDEICFEVNPAKKNSHTPATVSISLARAREILSKDWYACYLQMTATGICR